MRRLYTPEQAAAEDELNCSPQWLIRQARQKKIPFTMIAGKYRFTEAHIAQIIQQFEVQPSEHKPTRSTPPRRKPAAPAPQTTTTVTQLKARPPKRRVTA